MLTMKVPAVCIVLLLLPTNGEGWSVDLLATPSFADGVICANQTIKFTCQMFDAGHIDQSQNQYWWSFGGKSMRNGKKVEVKTFSSRHLGKSLNISCKIHAQVKDQNVSAASSFTVVAYIDTIPRIDFQAVNDGDYGGDMHVTVVGHSVTSIKLTATVVSISDLKLNWSLPKPPPPNIIKNQRDGDKTTTTLILDKTIDISGIYTLQAINKCGKNSSMVELFKGKPQILFESDYVNIINGQPFSLTGVIMSRLNLTTFYWSPPDHSGPLPNHTQSYTANYLTVVILKILRSASLNDSGNYTLTAVNSFGSVSKSLEVKIRLDCPAPKSINHQPSNFIAVEGYNATMKCSFDGDYLRDSAISIWVLFPGRKKPVKLDDHQHSDCKCSVFKRPACSSGTPPSRCCRFELIMNYIPQLKHNGTEFSCAENFSKEDTAWMIVVPSPKVTVPPSNLSIPVGSNAIFTCDFEASADDNIAQIYWEFNGNDMAEYKKIKDKINFKITNYSNVKNHISTTLEIYSVQAGNIGQYTCYCSYDTSLLNVNSFKMVQSEHKSATLSIQQGTSESEMVFIIIVCLIVILFALISFIWIYHYVNIRKRRNGYEPVPGTSGLERVTDEVLNQYINEEVGNFWMHLGKALNLSGQFLDYTLPRDQDSAERLRMILREWRDTASNPSVSRLNEVYNELGLAQYIQNNNNR